MKLAVAFGTSPAIRTGSNRDPVAPSIVFGLTYATGWRDGGNVPGAADNLAASAVTVALCISS